MKKNILIVQSDPLSINYEIIQKSIFFFKRNNNNNYFFVGCYDDFIKNIYIKNIKLNFINVKFNNNIKIYIKNCFEKSFNLLLNKKAHGLINLPLNKKYLNSKYPGVTEYIADYFKLKDKETMLLYSDKFSVCPNTIHIPLKNVPKMLKKKNIYKNIININNFYKTIIGIKNPKIALIGLNPHNGIDFKYPTEENKIIIPAINKAKKKGINIIGPLVPDSAFNQIKKNKIVSLLGNYHDQVLPMFKYINKFKGINITLGLPFIRVSLDHGTGLDIVGQNKANPESFLYALNFFENYFKKL